MKKTIAGITVGVVAAAGIYLTAVNPLPDSTRTPGAIDPTKTKEVICDPRYTTKSVRPPAHYTTALKIKQMKAWGLPGSPKDYEEDHLISLELGGCPTCETNLWPEPYLPLPGAHQKDTVENFLHLQVCSDKMTLEEAQQIISSNWLKFYISHFPQITAKRKHYPSDTEKGDN